jgi:hypothetical protein
LLDGTPVCCHPVNRPRPVNHQAWLRHCQGGRCLDTTTTHVFYVINPGRIFCISRRLFDEFTGDLHFPEHHDGIWASARVTTVFLPSPDQALRNYREAKRLLRLWQSQWQWGIGLHRRLFLDPAEARALHRARVNA